MTRALKDAVETKVDEELGQDHPMLPWIVKYLGTVITRYRIGKDVRAAYYRIKGKNPSNRVVPLCERVLYMPLKSAGKKDLVGGQVQVRLLGRSPPVDIRGVSGK